MRTALFPTVKTTTVTALVLAGVLAVAGCSTSTPEPEVTEVEVVDPTPTQTADTGDDDVIVDPPEQEPEPVVVPDAGTTVAADEVEALRDAGASVYVSPNGDGSGLILDPASTELPAPVVDDIKSAHPATPPQTMEEFSERGLAAQTMNGAMEDADLSAFYLMYAPNFGADNQLKSFRYVVLPYNIPDAREWATAAGGDTRSDTKAGAIANTQSLMDANPGVPLIDTTA